LLATAYSKALAASATDQEPSVEDVWQELVGKAWTDMIGIAEPDESTRQKHPYGPRLDRPR
jgi:hypothetical protein